MRFEVLGPVRGFREDEELSLGGRQQRLVLALLIAADGHAVSTGQLIDGVWGEQPPTTAKKALQGYVHHLRSHVGDVLMTERSGYSIRLDGNVDAAEFARLQREGSALVDVDPGRAGEVLRESLELWNGPAFADLADELALAPERARLDDLRIVALGDLVEAELAMGRHVALIGQLEGLTLEYPLHERFRAQHMTALYRAGRQVEALRSYEHLRRYLLDEMGLEPSVELQRLEQRILSQDPDLLGPADSTDSTSMTVRGYELRELVSSGPSGETYRAYQRSVGREMAVKVLSREVADDPEFIANFIVDTKAVAALEHPHICFVVDTWREPGRAYRVSRWLAGGSLEDVLRAGTLGVNSAMPMLDQVGGALADAHRHGVVHGQISPSHVLFDESGFAYLAEFMIGGSRRVDAARDRLDFAALAHLALTGRPPTVVDGALAPDLHGAEMKGARAVFEVAFSPGGYARVEDFLRSLRQATGLDTVAPPDRDGSARREVRNPYKGLQAFQESDASDFHGRDDLVDTVTEQLARHRLVAVVGPSGSGKSSLVKAGVVPHLRSLNAGPPRLISEMYPGAYPFEELEAALLRVGVNRETVIQDLLGDERGLVRVLKQVLPSDDAELVLVIDQFEELFSMVTDEEVRRLFLASLVAATADPRSRLRLVVTMRADFFDWPLQYPEFGATFNEGLVPVAVPNDEQLASAIAEPARSVGVEYEPGLISHIVHEISGQPGGLPLLQYALTELFDERDSNILTLAAYQQSGGVLGALGRRAESLYTELRPDAQHAARHAFLRMVAIDDSTDDLRRRVRRADLSGVGVNDRALNEAIQNFGAHRLLTFDLDAVTRGPTVEVAHEALLREWPRLDRWIDEQREDLVVRKRLEVAMTEWRNSGEDPSYLPSGNRLTQFNEWVIDASLAVNADEHAFLQAGLDRDATNQRRVVRRRRGALVGLAAVAVVLAIAAVYSNAQRRDADAAAAAAEDVAATADAAAAAIEDQRLTAVATSVSNSDMSLGLLLAVEAFRRDPSPVALGTLLTALTANGTHLGFGPPDRDYAGIATTDDGDLLVLDHDSISLVAPLTREVIRTWEIDTPPADANVIDASRLAIGGDTAMYIDADRRIRLLDIGDPEAEADPIDVGSVGGVDMGWLSPTGRHGLFLSDESERLSLIELETGRSLWSLDPDQLLKNQPFDVHLPNSWTRWGAAESPSAVFVDDRTVAIAAFSFLGTFDVADGTPLDVAAPFAGENQDRLNGTIVDNLPTGGFLVAGLDIVSWYDADLVRRSTVEFPPAESFEGRAAIADVVAHSGDRATVLFGNGSMWEVDRANGTRRNLVSTEIGGWSMAHVADQSLFAIVGESGMAYLSSDGRGPLNRSVPREPGQTKLAVGYGGAFAASSSGSGGAPTIHVCAHTGCTQYETDFEAAAIQVSNGSPHQITMLKEVLGGTYSLRLLDPVNDRLQSTRPQLFNPSPDVVATTDNSVVFPEFGGLQVKRLETGNSVEWIQLPEDWNEVGGAYDPNTERLLVVLDAATHLLVDTRTWQLVDLPQPFPIAAAAWNHDGSLLATVDDTGQVAIREGATWELITVVASNRQASTAFVDQPLAFSADDRYLVGVTNGAAQLWDVASGQQIGPIIKTEPGTTPAVAPGDVVALVTAGPDSTLLWNLDVSTWADTACDLAGRNMTEDEWTRFGPQGEPYRATCPEWPTSE